MISFHRIIAVLLRMFYIYKRSLDRISDAFYWPALDLFIWGLTSKFFVSQTDSASHAMLIILSGVIFWIIVWRGQYEVSGSLLEDLWNKNLINIFVAPLKFSEWILAFIILSIGKAILSFSFAVLLAYLLYSVQIFFYGFSMLPFLLLLIMTGWAVGFFVAGLILRFGTKVQTFAWTLVWAIAPFSALYYPVSTLPVWAQKIAIFIPTSYVFEGMREVINSGSLDTNKMIISFLLNIIYLILSLIFLRSSFNKALNKGLISVY